MTEGGRTGPEHCQSCLKIASSYILAIPQSMPPCHFMIFWLILDLMVNYWVFKILFAIKHVFMPVPANDTKAHCSQKDQFLCYGYYKGRWIYVILRYPNVEALSTEELLAPQGRKIFYLETLYINYDFLLHSLLLGAFAWKQDPYSLELICCFCSCLLFTCLVPLTRCSISKLEVNINRLPIPGGSGSTMGWRGGLQLF